MDYKLNGRPNWLYEAAILLSEQDADRIKKLIKNHSSFGRSKEEMEEGLRPYMAYRDAVLPKIAPILKDHPHLKRYFKDIPSPEDHLGAAPTIAAYLGKSKIQALHKDEIDTLVFDFIVDTVSSYAININDKKVKLDTLEDLLTYMDRENVVDETKLLLIDLHHNRYKIVNEVITLLQKCAPICETHFHMMKDDFEKTSTLVKDKEMINQLLDTDASVNLILHERIDAFISLSNFNTLSLIEGIDGFVMYIGVYFFEYLKLKADNRFNDTQIIADLKALGDATRLKIVHLLAEQKMYVQELANALALTPATVSHHINVLLKSELITVTLDTEKPKTIYYTLNNGKIHNLGNTIQNLADYEEV